MILDFFLFWLPSQQHLIRNHHQSSSSSLLLSINRSIINNTKMYKTLFLAAAAIALLTSDVQAQLLTNTAVNTALPVGSTNPGFAGNVAAPNGNTGFTGIGVPSNNNVGGAPQPPQPPQLPNGLTAPQLSCLNNQPLCHVAGSAFCVDPQIMSCVPLSQTENIICSARQKQVCVVAGVGPVCYDNTTIACVSEGESGNALFDLATQTKINLNNNPTQ